MKTRSGYLFKRNHAWYCQVNENGQRTTRTMRNPDDTPCRTRREAEAAQVEFMRLFTAKDKVEALKTIAARIEGEEALIAKLEETQNPPLTIADAWAAYERSPRRPDSGESTMRGYRDSINKLAEWVTEKHPATVALRDVTPDLAAAFAQSLTTISPSTFNQRIGFLRLLWKTVADEARTGGANPWTTIARRKLQPLANRKRPLSPHQFAAIHAAAAIDPDLQDLLTVLAWTGQRLVDGLSLRWEAVNFRGKVITLYPVKTARRTGKAVYIPMFAPLVEVLNRRHAAMPHTTAAAYVFPVLMEDFERDPPSISKRIQETFEKAGIKTKEKRTGTALKRAVVLYGAHSFRHLFVTAAAAAGLPAAMIKAITGHTTDAMSEHYQQFDVKLASEFAKQLTGKKPAALPPGREPIPAWARERLAGMTAKTWKAVRDELLTSNEPAKKGGTD